MLRRSFLTSLPALALLSSCSRNKPASNKIRLALNWKPDPQFGGFYAAQYAAHGLEVEILPGGAGTPTVQMIGAGSAEFGIVSADELVIARSRGNDVVALFAAYQNNPQAIMAHASRKISTFAELLQGGTLAIQKGLPYARMLEKQYGFSKVQIVPSPGGDISSFLNDPEFAQQCFVMSEPLAARHKGADVLVFPISAIGYNPYTTVMATSGDYLRKNPTIAASMVTAVREGWSKYLDDPKPTNQRMNQLNPSMAPEVFAEVAEAQEQFIEVPNTAIGFMTKERWNQLITQLKELGDIEKAPTPEECFKLL